MNDMPRLYADRLRRAAFLAGSAAVALVLCMVVVHVFAENAIERQWSRCGRVSKDVESELSEYSPLSSWVASLDQQFDSETGRVERLSAKPALAKEGELAAAKMLRAGGNAKMSGAAKSFIAAVEAHLKMKNACGKLGMREKSLAGELYCDESRKTIRAVADISTRLRKCNEGLKKAPVDRIGIGELLKLNDDSEDQVRISREYRSKESSGLGKMLGHYAEWTSATNEAAQIEQSMVKAQREANDARAMIDSLFASGGVSHDVAAKCLAGTKQMLSNAVEKVELAQSGSESAIRRLRDAIDRRTRRIVSSTNRIESMKKTCGSYLGVDMLTRAGAALRAWNAFCERWPTPGLASVTGNIEKVRNAVDAQIALMSDCESTPVQSLKALGELIAVRDGMASNVVDAIASLESNGAAKKVDEVVDEAEGIVKAVEDCEREAKECIKRIEGNAGELNERRNSLQAEYAQLTESIANVKRKFSKYNGGVAYRSLYAKLDAVHVDSIVVTIPSAIESKHPSGATVSRFQKSLDSVSATIAALKERLSDVQKELDGCVSDGRIRTLRFVGVDLDSKIKGALRRGDNKLFFWLDIPDARGHTVEIRASKGKGTLSYDVGSEVLPIAACLQHGSGKPVGRISRFNNRKASSPQTMASLQVMSGNGHTDFLFAVKCTYNGHDLPLASINWDCMDFAVYLDGEHVQAYIAEEVHAR